MNLSFYRPWARSLRTTLTKSAQGLMLLLGVVLSASADDKPNILVIWGDDIGWMNTSAYHRGMMG